MLRRYYLENMVSYLQLIYFYVSTFFFNKKTYYYGTLVTGSDEDGRIFKYAFKVNKTRKKNM